MARRGGVADKLGNRFEGIWTVSVLLDLLAGSYRSITVEPIGDEDAGIEFVAVTSGGVNERYSIKRQHSKGEWTVSRLLEAGVMEALTGKAGSLGIGVFCSGSSATVLEELIDSAKGSDSFQSFERRIRQSDRLEQDLQRLVDGSFEGDVQAAYGGLNRLRVETENEPRLVKNVERHIEVRFRRADGGAVDSEVIRLSLADLVLDSSMMARVLTEGVILSFLLSKGIRPSNLAGDPTTLAGIKRCNSRLLSAANRRLINGQQIARGDTERALNELLDEGKSVTIEGEAGSGKSCIVAQVVAELQARNVPCLALSLDRLGEADTTAERLGQSRGLPHSPTATLGEYAGQSRSVLVLDQLDALSRTSGRQRLGWDAVSEILEEIGDYPEMRVLFACRSFDIQHDPEIKAHADRPETLARVKVPDLTEEEIRQSIAISGIAPPVLSDEQLNVLARPLHLSLFLEATAGGAVDFAAAGDLFDAFWERKAQEVNQATAMHPSAWDAANAALCDVLSQRESLVAPEHTLGSHLPVVRVMRSSSVVRIDEGEVQYFHESFFDYAFARNFLSTGGDLVEWLAADEQHLFRRSQVRQVLAFLRRHPSDRAEYERTLRELLQSTDMRRHIKTLVLGWLSALPDPSDAEWRIVEQLEPALGDRIWRVVANSIPWFDLLDELGRWDSWLGAADGRTDRAVALLSLPAVIGGRTERCLTLLTAHRDGSPEWKRWLASLVRPGPALEKPELRALLFDLISEGAFDDQPSELGGEANLWTLLYVFNRDSPEFSALLLGAWLDRQIRVADARDPADPFGSDSPLVQYDGFSNDAIQNCANRAPSAFIREILPRFIALDGVVPHVGLWGPDPFGMPDRFFREELIRALRSLARDDPSQFDAVASDIIGNDFPSTKWTASVLLDAWTENPVRYAEQVVDVLLEHTELWLEPEGGEWNGSLDSYLEVARRALAVAAPHCSDDAVQQVEAEVLNKDFGWERGTDFVGLSELELLLSLPAQRLGSTAAARIAELRGKFPDTTGVEVTTSLEDTSSIQPVPSPLSLLGAGPYSDAQWLTAMQQFRDPRPGFVDGQFVGGSGMLARELEDATRADPQRFVTLAQKMDNTYAPTYFAAVLAGLTRDETGRQRADHYAGAIATLRRLNQNGIEIRGGDVARAISALADFEIPEDIIDMLCSMALHDPDPVADAWEGSNGWRSPVDQAINTARGTAAQSIAQLLAANADRWDALSLVVERLVEDRVLAVRTTAVLCLAAVLDGHQAEALALFSRLAQGAESILSTVHVERFIHNALFLDYTSLRPILLAMLESGYPDTVKVAARQVAVAALYTDSGEARDDELSLLAAGADARSAAASIYAVNLSNDSVADTCEARLLRLVDDEDAGVRDAAASWMRSLTPNEIAEQGTLIGALAASGSLGGHVAMLARRLDEATAPLPIEMCAFAEAAVAEDQTHVSGAFHLASLAIRLYEQHRNGATEDRLRMLDLIDELVWLGAHGIDDELRGQYER